MVTSLLLPAGIPLCAAMWEQTPIVVRQLGVHLLDAKLASYPFAPAGRGW